MRLSPCFAQSRQKSRAQTRRENGRTGICARRGGNNAVMQTLSRPLVIVCFGTPAIAGDSLGPEVGTLLRSDARFPAFVYGTLDRPVTGKNMTEWMKFLREAHKDAVMLAVDACLGERTQLGKITVRNDGVCPAAVGGRKNRFGDVGIIAVVGDKNGDALTELMQANALYVSKLAHKVADLIKSAVGGLGFAIPAF